MGRLQDPKSGGLGGGGRKGGREKGGGRRGGRRRRREGAVDLELGNVDYITLWYL